MKAVLYTAFGPPDVLQLHEVQKPSPQTNEVLVKVHAASINALEWRRFTMPAALVRMFSGGLFEPKNKTIGADFAGRVEAVGASVTRFKPGDEVFGIKRGSFADYVCALETLVTPKPANVSFEAASTVPVAALTALQAIRDQGNTQPGQHVLIYGAGGGVGTFAVQIAKYFGAEVTAICGPQSQDTARAIGSDHVIDYTKEDFTKSASRYDRIIAVNGHQSILDYRRALKPTGSTRLPEAPCLRCSSVLFLERCCRGAETGK